MVAFTPGLVGASILGLAVASTRDPEVDSTPALGAGCIPGRVVASIRDRVVDSIQDLGAASTLVRPEKTVTKGRGVPALPVHEERDG